MTTDRMPTATRPTTPPMTPPIAARPLTRRTVLAGATAATAALALPGTTAHATGTSPEARITELEGRHGISIGLYARNLGTGRTLAHREDQRFPICSIFKVLAAAAVLDQQLVVPDPRVLRRPVHLPPAALVEYSPFMEPEITAGRAPEVAAVCEATLQLSDNTAGNALLSLIGGPGGVSAFARTLGDSETRLDRWEPELNSAEPGSLLDTTTPRAVGGSIAELLVGTGLRPAARRRLTEWMLGNRTSDDRFRAGLPDGWTLADKTGGGSYAVNNNVGVAWSPTGEPVLLSALTRADDPATKPDNAVLAELAALAVADLG